MIQIVLVCTEEGELASCKAEGHALFSKKGADIVCSAVTTLLRTTLSVLESNKFIVVETVAPSRGMLSFCVKEKTQGGGEDLLDLTSSMLIYAKVFLENGLTLLCSEYPEYVSLNILIEKDVD